MATLYVASTETFVGKSAVCLGLLDRARRDGFTAGYMKPVSVALTRDEDVVLVAGDFNFDPRWASDEDIGTWSMLTSRLEDCGEGIGPTLMGLLRIDHVLVRGGRACARVVSQRRLPLGDHDAVVCDVELPVRESTRLRLAVG